MKKSIGAKTIVFPAPVWVVGTYDKDENPNVMTVAWGGICCSKPQSVNISLRKATYSYNAIEDRKAFTINIPSEEYAKEADFIGTSTGKRVDKFSSTGLTPVKSELVDAPYVKEFPLILECKLIHTIEAGLHTLFIGEIIDVKADDAVLGEEGLPDIEKVKPIIFSPVIRTYHGVGKHIGKAFSIGRKIEEKPKTNQA